MNGWIKCEDKLPEKDGTYLVALKRLSLISSFYYRVYWFTNDLYKIDEYDFYDKKGESGFYDFDSETGYYDIPDVIAWMPIPVFDESVYRSEQVTCNKCEHYEGVHEVAGNAPCSCLNRVVLWNWSCPAAEPYEFYTNEEDK